MKRDNRGLTLVELIIAVTMTTIIIIAATIFLNNAMKSYRVAHETINLQMDAHVLMEQIGVWVMEGNYVVTNIPGGGSNTITKDATDEKYDTLIDGKNALAVYCIPRPIETSRLPGNTYVGSDGRVVQGMGGGTGLPTTKRVIWLDDGGLYMTQTNVSGDPEDDLAAYSLPTADITNCISPYVTGFTCRWDEDRETYDVVLTLKAGHKEYTLKDEIKMRNQYVAPGP